MAVNFNSNANSSTNAPAGFKKADVFVNFYIELADGTKVQFGEKGIGLYGDKRTDAAHIKRLTEGGPEALEALLKVLKVNLYVPGNQAPVSNVGY